MCAPGVPETLWGSVSQRSFQNPIEMLPDFAAVCADGTQAAVGQTAGSVAQTKAVSHRVQSASLVALVFFTARNQFHLMPLLKQ